MPSVFGQYRISHAHHARSRAASPLLVAAALLLVACGGTPHLLGFPRPIDGQPPAAGAMITSDVATIHRVLDSSSTSGPSPPLTDVQVAALHRLVTAYLEVS